MPRFCKKDKSNRNPHTVISVHPPYLCIRKRKKTGYII